jgi:hypothetical protein
MPYANGLIDNITCILFKKHMIINQMTLKMILIMMMGLHAGLGNSWN